MTDNNSEEKLSMEESEKKNAESEMLQKQFKSPSLSEAPFNAFDIQYIPHKTQGLQSASDMWIDKGRLMDGLSHENVDLEKIKRLTRQ